MGRPDISKIYSSAKKIPCGFMLLESDGESLTASGFITEAEAAAAREAPDGIISLASRELDAYFAGSLREFSVPLGPEGTPFMLRVWNELRKVPYGRTASYKDVAIACGNSRAVRAVGLANNRNPLPIFIPCHRIIGADGRLSGYGGGTDIKKFLLDLESGAAGRA